MYRMMKLLGLLVAIMSVNAFGVGILGTPTAELDQGQWNIGFNYAYLSTDLATTTMKSSEGSYKLEINDNNVNRYYGSIGYGLTSAWEAYVQLGWADVKANVKEPGEPDSGGGLNFDNDFAWGWGTRYTFYEQDKVRWGVTVQMNWLDTSFDEKGPDWKTTIDYSDYDLLVGVGPTVDMGGWKLYGGPFYYMLDGDLDVKGVDAGDAWKESGDLEEDSNFGGFIGAQCTVMEKYDVTTEFSFTGDGWAVGAGIYYAF
jgi:hypothetical protein